MAGGALLWELTNKTETPVELRGYIPMMDLSGAGFGVASLNPKEL
jgi:hypothetical protein